MGPELALALAVGGTAAQMYGQHRADKKRREILNRAMEDNSKTQDLTNRQILDEAANFRPGERAQAMQSAEDAAYQQAQADTGGAAAGIPQASGDVSAQYLKARADSAIDEGSRLTALAREAAKVRAPGTLTREEALRRAALTGDLNSEWSTRRNMTQAAQEDADSVGMPWYGQLGQLASAVGSAALMAPTAAAPAAAGATNAALAESAAGLPGIGASSASAVPWWQSAGKLATVAAPRIRFGR